MGTENNIVANNGEFYDPMSVTWLGKYDEKFSKFWNKLPKFVGKCIAALATFLFGISVSGNWVSLITYTLMQLNCLPKGDKRNSWSSLEWEDFYLLNKYLNNFQYYFLGSNIVSYGIYYAIGGFLHWYYYVRRRDRAEEWKCQPKKWLSPELERHEIIFGSITLFMNSTISALLTCHVSNGGYSTIYFNVSDYGWLWFLLQYPIIFVYMDFATYWLHRMYHWPWLYKHFHKLHHKYKQPTAFSVTAIHPVEAVHIQMTLVLPMFIVPVHWFPFYCVPMYNYVHGILDHSGINFKAQWWQPWQPDTIFHDNHHQYFHVNFGFNMEIWDKIFGTCRRKDRIYREDIFFGKGKTFSEVTSEEFAEDLEERNSENPLAYQKNVMPYKLRENEIKILKK